jgi:hypothetical protein
MNDSKLHRLHKISRLHIAAASPPIRGAAPMWEVNFKENEHGQ